MSDKNKDAPGSGDIKNDKVSAKSLGTDEVQHNMDVETEQGFAGTKVDQTPDENYSVAGVTSGKPTPETDPAMAAKMGNQKFVHVDEAKGGKK